MPKSNDNIIAAAQGRLLGKLQQWPKLKAELKEAGFFLPDSEPMSRVKRICSTYIAQENIDYGASHRPINNIGDRFTRHSTCSRFHSPLPKNRGEKMQPNNPATLEEVIDHATRMADDLNEFIAEAQKADPENKNPLPGTQQLVDEWEALYARIKLASPLNLPAETEEEREKNATIKLIESVVIQDIHSRGPITRALEIMLPQLLPPLRLLDENQNQVPELTTLPFA